MLAAFALTMICSPFIQWMSYTISLPFKLNSWKEYIWLIFVNITCINTIILLFVRRKKKRIFFLSVKISPSIAFMFKHTSKIVMYYYTQLCNISFWWLIQIKKKLLLIEADHKNQNGDRLSVFSQIFLQNDDATDNWATKSIHKKIFSWKCHTFLSPQLKPICISENKHLFFPTG